jgi:hypothetical protein
MVENVDNTRHDPSGWHLAFRHDRQTRTWGSAERDCPVSAIVGASLTPLPFIAKGARVFRGQQSIELGCIDSTAEIWYAFQKDGDDSGIKPKEMNRYKAPFTIANGGRLVFWTQKDEETSRYNVADFAQIPEDLHVLRYNTRYNAQYTARGDEGLIDGIRGSKTDFRTGDWQGFEGTNLDLVIDLGKSKKSRRSALGSCKMKTPGYFSRRKCR